MSLVRWRMMMSGLRVRRTSISSPVAAPSSFRGYAKATAPRMKPQAQATGDHGQHENEMKKRWLAGEFMPVYVALGMITLSVTLGVYTAKEQIMHAPNVRVRKRERERVGEVVDPARVAVEGDKFVKGSFFRKVAHVQELDTNAGGEGGG